MSKEESRTKGRRRSLNAKGEFDYDLLHDILFFKVKDREYDHSLEFRNLVLDIDKHHFVTGLQMLEASKFLRVEKVALRNIRKFNLETEISKNKLELRLMFEYKFRNKLVHEKPILMRELPETMPDSKLTCLARVR